MTLSDINALVFELLSAIVALMLQPPIFWFVAVALIISTLYVVKELINVARG